MCIKVANSEFEANDLGIGFYNVSVTGYLLNEVNRYRNVSEDAQDLQFFATRISAELMYAALVLASLVEIAVRIVLTLVGLPIAIYLDHQASQEGGQEPDKVQAVALFAVLSLIHGPDTTLRCLAALVQNTYVQKMDFDGLALYEIELPI
jgi:hypothetical protein